MYSSAGLPGTGLYAVITFERVKDSTKSAARAGGCGCAMLATMVLGRLFAMRAC
jgi:hypothetical protein